MHQANTMDRQLCFKIKNKFTNMHVLAFLDYKHISSHILICVAWTDCGDNFTVYMKSIWKNDVRMKWGRNSLPTHFSKQPFI